MYKIQYVLAILLISVSARAVPFSDVWNFENEKLSGKVKTITFKHKSGGKTVSVYTLKKQFLLHEVYDSDGKLKLRSSMKYDDSGKLRYLAFFSQYKMDEPKYTETAEYLENGELKVIKRVQGENGYKSDNAFTENITYMGGYLKEIKVKYEKKTVAFLYKFSKKGQLLETFRKDAKSPQKYFNTLTYDKKGRVNRIVRWKNGEKCFETRFNYLYDRSGNWIERTTTKIKHEGGYTKKVAKWTDYREITYYYNNK